MSKTKPTLDDLKQNVSLAKQAVEQADQDARQAASAAVTAAQALEKEPDNADLKAASDAAVEASQQANATLEGAKTQLEQHEQLLSAAQPKKAKSDDEEKPAAAAAAEPADPEDDPKYVPIFRDEEGERIPRNSLIRVVTTTTRNLRALDGTLITPEPTAELKGPDVRKGDWYTVQYQAGLIQVDSIKKMR